HRIIEVGIVELDADGTAREWSRLVNPGCRIPSDIEAFTGISSEMVEDAPPFNRLADEIAERLAGRLFVAHNARFDYGFLRQEFQRLGRKFRSEVLCTVKLSRLLSPEEPRHNLDAVMERHGLSTLARHRALGDARVLYDLWQVLRAIRPADELEAAIAELTRRPTLPEHLPAELVDDLPDGPGVYRFFGDEGALLYVGKGKSIRSRVLSHFASAAGGGKDAKLARLVRRVEWTETAGEFGALLLEARLVKSELPIFNRRLRAAETLHAIELKFVDGWLRAAVVPLPEAAPQAERFGLFRRAADGERALKEIIRTHRLCAKRLGREAGEGSCFAYQLGQCRGACVGVEPAERHNVRLQIALSALRIASWPFAGAIAVTERDANGHATAHLFDHWSYLGSTDDDEGASRLVRLEERHFDPDIYRVLKRYLARAPRNAVRELSAAARDTR
ncbi:MAG: exonuclease domain-containing protein, partial [Steroidobacteraceae bacterium]